MSRVSLRECVSIKGTARVGLGYDIPPVSTPPPRFLSLGIPPAKRPPNWGAPSTLPLEACPLLPWSLLLLARLPGAGGASPPGGLGAEPGTGGAPPTGGPPPPEGVPTAGAERSFVTVFLRALPLPMSDSRAFCGRKRLNTA